MRAGMLVVLILLVALVLVSSGCVQEPEDFRYCDDADDCVHVGCSCDCIGCGGFDYEDVVNSKYENLWYEMKGCMKPEICLTACCDPRYIACENNICNVIEGVAECASEGKAYSFVYTDEYPEHCCEGLTEWPLGMYTGISIEDVCYETGMESGNPIGICINCGNGVCEEIEDVCSCPDDCTGQNRSEYLTVENFCLSEYWESFFRDCEEGQLKELPICGLCEYAKLDDRCTLEPETGPCEAYMPRYYFNQTEGICKEFIWGGCGGTVPFETLEECQTACENWIESCSKISICQRDDDCEYIWYTGGCYNPDYVGPCNEYQRGQGILPSEAPPRENVTCSCENNECITHG